MSDFYEQLEAAQPLNMQAQEKSGSGSPNKLSLVQKGGSTREQASQSQIRQINVGGEKYWTLKQTLEQVKSQGSPLLQVAYLEQTNIPKDENGVYFIDRDPKYFRLVLNFLRDGTISVKQLSQDALKELKQEAAYYQIMDLVLLCDEKLGLAQVQGKEVGKQFYQELVETLDKNTQKFRILTQRIAEALKVNVFPSFKNRLNIDLNSIFPLKSNIVSPSFQLQTVQSQFLQTNKKLMLMVGVLNDFKTLPPIKNQGFFNFSSFSQEAYMLSKFTEQDVPQIIMDYASIKMTDSVDMACRWEGLHEYQNTRNIEGKNKFNIKVDFINAQTQRKLDCKLDFERCQFTFPYGSDTYDTFRQLYLFKRLHDTRKIEEEKDEDYQEWHKLLGSFNFLPTKRGETPITKCALTHNGLYQTDYERFIRECIGSGIDLVDVQIIGPHMVLFFDITLLSKII